MKKRLLWAAACLAVLSGCRNTAADTRVQLLPDTAFDTILDGKPVSLYTLLNANGMAAQVTNYGARVVALWVPDAQGGFRDVVWGYPSIGGYLSATDKFGGPIVGRYGNRIDNGQFSLDGKTYRLTINDGSNHLHGGSGGFWSKVWTARQFTNERGEQAVEMSYRSPSGEQGYPGELSIAVTYTLTGADELRIDYRATTDSATVLNPTRHNYFNLHGHTGASTDSHLLTIHADRFTPTDSGLIPTGELASVEGTPLDFRSPTAIGARIASDFEPMKLAGGYDHNWVLTRPDSGLTVAAELYEPSTGIVMTVTTDQPGLQFYSGNFMDGRDTGKRGDRHDLRTGIALETQNFPDAPNHDDFPSAVLRPGETYTQTCIYGFGIRRK